MKWLIGIMVVAALVLAAGLFTHRIGNEPSIQKTDTFLSASGAMSPVDGYAEIRTSNLLFSDIRNGKGNHASATDTTAKVLLAASTSPNRFAEMLRQITCFDTSTIPDKATITNATISFYGRDKSDGLGEPSLQITNAIPDSTSDVTSADYEHLGDEPFDEISFEDFTVNGYNTVILNEGGVAAIKKQSVACWGQRLSWDLNNSFTGTWKSARQSYFEFFTAEHDESDREPKLEVTYYAP